MLLCYYESILLTTVDRGSTVVKVLCYKSEGRWFDPSWYQWAFFIDIKSFRSHYGWVGNWGFRSVRVRMFMLDHTILYEKKISILIVIADPE